MTGGEPPLRFNRMPRVSEVPLGGGRTCLVFDGVLADPEAWVDFAATHASHFVESTANAYPGPELPLPIATTLRSQNRFRLPGTKRSGRGSASASPSRFDSSVCVASSSLMCRLL